MARREFTPGEGCLEEVRHFVRSETDASSLGVVIVAAEIVSHLLPHAPSKFAVTVVSEPDLWLQVSDGASLSLALEDLVHESDGLGVSVLHSLTVQWGMSNNLAARSVWAAFPPN